MDFFMEDQDNQSDDEKDDDEFELNPEVMDSDDELFIEDGPELISFNSNS
jgi:hypothetical protein